MREKKMKTFYKMKIAFVCNRRELSSQYKYVIAIRIVLHTALWTLININETGESNNDINQSDTYEAKKEKTKERKHQKLMPQRYWLWCLVGCIGGFLSIGLLVQQNVYSFFIYFIFFLFSLCVFSFFPSIFIYVFIEQSVEHCNFTQSVYGLYAYTKEKCFIFTPREMMIKKSCAPEKWNTLQPKHTHQTNSYL